jgi:transposase InsO family protein
MVHRPQRSWVAHSRFHQYNPGVERYPTIGFVLYRGSCQKPDSAAKSKKEKDTTEARSIPAWYPNHIWSIDTTMVFRWGLWPIHICVVIDHFSRKVMAAIPLEGPNAGWINNTLESAIKKHGAPKHIISDQANVFTGSVFAELFKAHTIKPRLGAVGKHGSIAVTERVIKTLKYEWLKRAALIKGLDHLAMLCQEFETWYNSWRPHMTLDGFRPDDVYHENTPKKPEREAKTVPWNIEQCFFRETKITGYRLKKAA